MNILVDTSVWVDHFKNSNAELMHLMMLDSVLIHPMVLGELACGTPPSPRKQTLADLGLLRPVHEANLTEVMAFIEQKKLYGLGCGLIDIHLLASTLITPETQLWTYDKRLNKLARQLNVAYFPRHH